MDSGRNDNDLLLKEEGIEGLKDGSIEGLKETLVLLNALMLKCLKFKTLVNLVELFPELKNC